MQFYRSENSAKSTVKALSQWSKATSDQEWEKDSMQDGNVLPVVVLGLSSSSGASSSCTSSSQDSSSTSSSVRSDEEASGNRGDHPKTPHQSKNKDNQEAAGNRLRDLAEWSEELKDNLEDAELSASANISHDPESERPVEVASRKHSIYTHFPKDRNCDVCLRSKITRAPCRRRTG